MHGVVKSQIRLKRLSMHACEARKRLHPGETLLSPSDGRLGPETVLGSLTTLQTSLCSHTCSVSAPTFRRGWSLSVASLEAVPSIRFSLFTPKHGASPATPSAPPLTKASISLPPSGFFLRSCGSCHPLFKNLQVSHILSKASGRHLFTVFTLRFLFTLLVRSQ